MIIMVNAVSLYLIDRRGNLKTRIELKNLREIILVKSSPCFFALAFRQGIAPLVLQSFRRSELMIFILAQREKAFQKPKVMVGDSLKVMSGG